MSGGAYRGDAFQIVRGASGFRGSAERLVVVFQCYLDDSGTSGLPVVTMAGFNAPMSMWEVLEPAFDEILNRYEVPVLHAKEFNDTRPPFKGWSKIKKRTFAEELFEAAQGRMLGLSMTVKKESFAKAKREHGFDSTSAYGLCFSAIMFQVVKNPMQGAAVRKDGLAFLVESGNKNNAEIEQAFDAWSRRKHFEGILRSISFISKESCRAIQVADFFAYFSRRYMRNKARFKKNFVLPMGPYLEIICNHVPVWQDSMTAGMTMMDNIDDAPDWDDLNYWVGPDAKEEPS